MLKMILKFSEERVTLKTKQKSDGELLFIHVYHLTTKKAGDFHSLFILQKLSC